MDADGAVEVFAVAAAFTRVVADAPVNGGEGIVADQHFPGFLEATRLRLCQPALNVFAGWAGIIAGWQQSHIQRVTGAYRPNHLTTSQVDQRTYVAWHFSHWLSPNN
jgi:hypothetical protein